VKRFEVVGSTIFSAAELAKITAPFTNRPIAFAELLQVQAAITKLYTDQGYITSGAVTPPQTIEGNVVTIQVVEGSLEAITVTGTKRLNPNYVRSRLAIATQKPLNSRRLLEALQLLQVNPLIQSISAELSTGTRPGTNLLEVRVTEAKTFGVQVALDNNRSPAVGSLRRRVQVSEANLLGLGDGLQVGYANTDGSNVIDFNYTLPLNPRNGTFSFAFNTSFNRIVEEPFEPLDLKASSRSFDLTFRQPLIETPSRLVALGVTASRQESETSILGVPFQLSLGANTEGRTRISALRLFQEWTERGEQSVFAIRSEFSFGFKALNATINDTSPDSRFVSWRGQLQWVRLLAPDTLLVLRSNVQIADRTLLSLEQFGLGGQDSVRGYRQDLLLADNGLLASAELRFPIARFRQNQGIVQIVPFVDFGAVWSSSGRANTDPNTLAAIGLGLRWQQGDRFTFRFDWGIPLVSVDSSKNTWQENGLYFSVVYNLF
jgi:hemolysin activation/secretion protein